MSSNWDSAPWAIRGTKISENVLRAMLYAATNGAEGVVGINDLKVLPQPAPTGQVRIVKGGALVRNRAAGQEQETYGCRLGVTDYVNIAKTGSAGGRTDLIYVKINDPWVPGSNVDQPEDPATFQYVETGVLSNVSRYTRELQDVTGFENATGYAIARVTLPANTEAVTAAMIEDLRAVANPRKDRQPNAYAMFSSQTQHITTTSGAGQQFPDFTANWRVDVPEWATKAVVVATWAQAQAKNDKNQSATGQLWARLGGLDDAASVNTQENSWDTVDTPLNGTSRQTFQVTDTVLIPEGLRGRSVPAMLMGRRAAASTASEAIVLDGQSSVAIDVEFIEGPA
jgi:hypothetical protein